MSAKGMMSSTDREGDITKIQIKSTWSYIVPSTSRSNERGHIRRYKNNNNNNIHNDEDDNNNNSGPSLSLYGCRTLFEGIRRGQKINPLGPCLGYRAVSTTTGFATPFIYMSYTETVSRINCIAAGLHYLNLIGNGDRSRVRGNTCDDDRLQFLGIYMKNCVEWVLCEHASYTIGCSTVPLYDTLGPDVVQFILTQTSLQSVVCSRSELGSLFEAKRTGLCPYFTTAIVVDGITPDVAQAANDSNVQVMTLAKVEAVGADYIIKNQYDFVNPPNPTDVATLCYTSGTTGTPKGAMLTHTNLISAASGTIRTASGIAEASISDRHLSYLPLPHIFERMVQTTVLCAGASIGFYRGDPMYLIEDIQACQPTLLPVAPRVLNKIYDKIYNGVNSVGGMKKKLFDRAVTVKTYNLRTHGQLRHTLYDALIFNKIKKALGMQHIRVMISGSAPLADNVMIFFRIMLGIPVLEGYGQTEGAAAATISHPFDVTSVGHVGGPTPATEIALYDVPEMGYYHTDKSHNNGTIPCVGRGEICIRGPNVFKGYYKEKSKTDEVIDREGWLHSGDIGLWRIDGSLQIIDRKKNLFKLSQGEYVAPEKIENFLVRSSYINQCFVYGDSFQSYLIAIVVPDEDIAKQWWNTNMNDNTEQTFSLDRVCQNDTFRTVILDDIKHISKEAQLNGFETVRAIHLLSTPFTVENDMITPTFKLKRQHIRDAYQTIIDKLYDHTSHHMQGKQLPTTSKL